MLKIRLMRIGARKRPFYRVVVVDERAKRTGSYVELVGTYDPLTTPKDIKLKQDRIDYWIKQGAQMSTGYLRIIGKAPQRLPRKAKKEKKEVPPAPAPTETPAPATKDVPAEQTEAPKQEEQPAPVVPTETSADTSDGGPEGNSSEVSQAETEPSQEETTPKLEQPIAEKSAETK